MSLARILSCQCRLQPVQFGPCLVFAAWRKSCRRLFRKHRLESVDEQEETTKSFFCTVGFKCFFWPQMDPRQSIDDILDEPITCVGKNPIINKEYILNGILLFFHHLILFTTSLSGSVNVCDHESPAHSVPGSSPLPPQADQSQASQQHKDDSFLPSPLCSSLLLELPPSPAVINPSQVIPAPPPPPICTSPLPSTGRSRKRRAPTSFDAADWLETLTSGLRPLTPPTAPFVESDFSLDSDLNVSRVLDLMVEQWWGFVWAYLFVCTVGERFWWSWMGQTCIPLRAQDCEKPPSVPPIIERLSESLAPRNVESWIHFSEQIKHGFDGATRAQTHAHTYTLQSTV